MTATADADAGPVFRLIYRSESRIPAEQGKTELGEIFTVARRKNRGLGVTGALLMSGDVFVQALEGQETVVRDLYTRIAEDERHAELSIVEEGTVGTRTFGRWAMAQVGAGGRADLRLVSNAKKGVIVTAGTDGSVTAEQEAVLAVMRRSVALDTLET